MIENLFFGVGYLLISDFLVQCQNQKNASNKDDRFDNTVSLKKTSFYKLDLTQHYKKYSPVTKPKIQKTYLWVVSDKTFALHHMHPKTPFSKHLESKYLYIPVNLPKKIFVLEM